MKVHIFELRAPECYEDTINCEISHTFTRLACVAGRRMGGKGSKRQCGQLQVVDLVAQLVEHCAIIAEVICSRSGLNFFQAVISQLYNCNNKSYLQN